MRPIPILLFLALLVVTPASASDPVVIVVPKADVYVTRQIIPDPPPRTPGPAIPAPSPSFRFTPRFDTPAPAPITRKPLPYYSPPRTEPVIILRPRSTGGWTR